MSKLELGQHRHINGDSTKVETFQQIMGNDKAKFLYADPPYCLLVRRNKKTGQLRDPKKAKINHEAVKRYENIKEYRHFTKQWLGAATQFMDDTGVLAIWTNFLGKQPIKDVAKDLGYKFHGEFLWGKLTKEVNSGNETNVRVYEVALIFSKNDIAELRNNDRPVSWSVITKYDEEKEADQWENHPNHKPFSSLEPLLRQYTQEGDIVLDPFTGSGSTPAASIKLGRVIRGVELRPHWAETSQKRIQSLVE